LLRRDPGYRVHPTQQLVPLQSVEVALAQQRQAA
jgi:hypothetical protein